MGYKTVGSFGHSSMVMLTSQLSSTWCTESIRRYVTFRKKHLSREKACSYHKTGELTAVQQHITKGNWKVPFQLQLKHLKIWVEMLGVYTGSSVRLCFSLQNWSAHYYPHLWKHTDSLFDFGMIWAVLFCPAPHSDFKFSRWGRGMSSLGEAYRISPGSVCVCSVDQAVKTDSLETWELAEDVKRFCASVGENKFVPVLPGLS